MALMDSLLNAAAQALGGKDGSGAQNSLTDMAMDLVRQQRHHQPSGAKVRH